MRNFNGLSCWVALGRILNTIWLDGIQYVPLLTREGSAFACWCLLIEHSWGNGCGGLEWKGIGYGGGWWLPGTGLFMGVGVLVKCGVLMGVVCGRVL